MHFSAAFVIAYIALSASPAACAPASTFPQGELSKATKPSTSMNANNDTNHLSKLPSMNQGLGKDPLSAPNSPQRGVTSSQGMLSPPRKPYDGPQLPTPHGARSNHIQKSTDNEKMFELPIIPAKEVSRIPTTNIGHEPDDYFETPENSRHLASFYKNSAEFSTPGPRIVFSGTGSHDWDSKKKTDQHVVVHDQSRAK